MKARGVSKYLSYLLRHGAIKEGYSIDSQGFVSVNEITKKMTTTFDEVKEIVETDDKKRFEIVEKNHQWYIRAVQGHSIELDDPGLVLVLDPSEIPTVVHGTNHKAYGLIKNEGLNKMTRTHIHFAKGLLSDQDVISGMRKSADVLIYINVEKAMAAGIKFYLSKNGVILSDGINGTISPEFFAKVDFVQNINHGKTKPPRKVRVPKSVAAVPSTIFAMQDK